jgi:hypothetical protein
MKSKPKPKPKTPPEWSAYRCQLSCKIGRDVLDGTTNPPAGISRMEYAMFNLLHAIEDLSQVVRRSEK